MIACTEIKSGDLKGDQSIGKRAYRSNWKGIDRHSGSVTSCGVNRCIITEFAKFAKKAGVNFFAAITGSGIDSNIKMNMYEVKREQVALIKTLGFERIAMISPEGN